MFVHKKSFSIIIILLLLLLLNFIFIAANHKKVNRVRTPIIGILAIDSDLEICQIYGPQVKSYIPTSYAKWLEAAGARVMPIWGDKDVAYYDNIINKINGILIPNANVKFGNITKQNCSGSSNHFYHSSKLIYKIAIRENENKNYFPIWSIDEGMHLLVMHSINSTLSIDPRWNCKLMDVALPLAFEKDYRKSRMLASLSQNVENDMRKEAFGYFHSTTCLVPDVLKLLQIEKLWRVLATKKGEMDLKLATLIEHSKYPFYGSQFHPERVRYEQFEGVDVCNHTQAAINAAQYFAEFFVKECRKSKNSFPTVEDEMQQLIWNHDVTLTRQLTQHWSQCYMFEDADINKAQSTNCCAIA